MTQAHAEPRGPGELWGPQGAEVGACGSPGAACDRQLEEEAGRKRRLSRGRRSRVSQVTIQDTRTREDQHPLEFLTGIQCLQFRLQRGVTGSRAEAQAWGRRPSPRAGGVLPAPLSPTWPRAAELGAPALWPPVAPGETSGLTDGIVRVRKRGAPHLPTGKRNTHMQMTRGCSKSHL